MKPIEGVNLADLLTVVSDRVKEQQLLRIQTRIEHLLGSRRTEIGSILALKAQLVKAEERLEKLTTKLEAIKAGTWEVLGEDEPLPKIIIETRKDSGQGAERPSGVSYEEGA